MDGICKKLIVVLTLVITGLAPQAWAFDIDEDLLAPPPPPVSHRAPSAPAKKQDGWFLRFEDLVNTETKKKSKPKKRSAGKPRQMLKPSTSKTKEYVKVNARRTLAGSGRVKAAREALGSPSIWSDGLGLSQKGKDLLRFIREESIAHGLRPSDYAANALEGGAQGGELEAIASKAYVHLVNDLSLGRLSPAKADYDWNIRQGADKKTVKAILAEAISAGNIYRVLESKAPQHRMYAGLSQALRKYQRQQQNWAPFPAAGPKLAAGTTHAHVSLLRNRLQLSGGATFDAELKAALQQFQRNHGLNADGVVGRRTRVALSRNAKGRIVQLEQSLERMRWLPNTLPDKYVFVNTAGYELNVREYDSTILNMRTVVGQKRRGDKNHETPSFSKKMRYVVVNPKWHVPASIISKEFLPKAQKDPGFFAKNNYTVYSSVTGAKVDPSSVNWHNYVKGEKIPYSAVQDFGNSNALGRLKFMFPNKYSIYLHDTPSKNLFKKERRSFSHGCVRLQQPVQLATALLGKSEQEIQSLIKANKNRRIDLQEPISVYIGYITAWARDDGTVVFFDDYYGHDKRMAHNFVKKQEDA